MKTLFLFTILFSCLVALGQTAGTYISRGNEHYLRLEFDLAEDQFRKAVEREPRNAEARYNLANALMQQKKFKAAIEEYDAITSDNKNLKAAAHYNAGVSYTKQQDLPASIEAYKAALRINPTDKDARENLQKALAEQKKQQNQQDQKNNKGGGGGMSQNEADKKLRDLNQKERDLQQKMQKGQGQGQGGGKDW